MCGVTLNAEWEEPLDPKNPNDVEAAERVLQMKLGWFASPIFGKDGDYSEVQKNWLVKRGKELGLPGSPLPEFTEEEKQNNKGNTL